MSKKYIINIVLFFLLIILIILLVYIFYYFHDTSLAKNQSLLINNIQSFQDNSFENDKKAVQKNERMTKIEKLQEKNKDIVGWIEIEGTSINYPVLQGTDNSFYLNHNYKKQKVLSGSIFLDADCDINPPYTNLLIYGHNMKNDTMFTSLLNYKNKKYYEIHPQVRFTTTTFDNTYDIIAAFESKVYDESDKSSFKYYNFINANNKSDFDYFISNIKKLSIYNIEKTAEYGDELITLSTCAYHTKNGRFAIVACHY